LPKVVEKAASAAVGALIERGIKEHAGESWEEKTHSPRPNTSTPL